MKNLYSGLRRIFFKRTCIHCNKNLSANMDFLCEDCYNNFKSVSSIKSKNEWLYYLWEYDGAFKELISHYKFGNLKGLSKFYSEIVAEKLKFVIEMEKIDVIIPVPISKHRRSIRGFNQVEEILECMGIKYMKIRRGKDTKHMYSLLSSDKRKRNIRGSFELSKNLKLDGKSILIFDDIVTTGTTFFEIKKTIIKKYNAEKIVLFSMAAAKTSFFKIK